MRSQSRLSPRTAEQLWSQVLARYFGVPNVDAGRGWSKVLARLYPPPRTCTCKSNGGGIPPPARPPAAGSGQAWPPPRRHLSSEVIRRGPASRDPVDHPVAHRAVAR